jgi:hypothetical protein
MRHQLTTLALGAALIAGGCGDDDTTTDDMGTVDMFTGTDAFTADEGVPDMGDPSGDGNDSFETADPIELGTPVADAVIDPAGDQDFYSFTGEEGQWVILSTEANPDDDPEMVDTVLTLYDSSMTQIAENDDGIPRFNTDSEIITRLPAAGTYYVRVLEFSDWADDTPEGMASFTYELLVAALDPDAVGVTVDAEGGDDVASSQNIGLSTSADGDFGLLVGDLRDGSDVDVYSFSVTASKPNAQFTVLPADVDGNGSTALPSAVWVTDMAGTEIIGRVDPSALPELSPGLPEGQYKLWIEHGGSAGSNDFYVLKVFRLTSDNPPEEDEVANGVAATAEPLTLADDDGDGISNGFILAELPDADVDHFSFAVEAGDVVSAFCGSRTAGSGVIDLTATITDVTGVTELGSDTETATEAVAIEELDVGGAGTYLLRLEKDSQDAEVTGDWVRCGVAVGPAS